MSPDVSKHPKFEQTFVMIKPDGVKRGLTGEIIRRIEQRGLKVIAIAMVQPTVAQVDGHYPKDETWLRRIGQKTLGTCEKYHVDAGKTLGMTDELAIGQAVRQWLIDFMVSGPVVKMVVEGIHAVDMVRKLCGHTLPFMAEMGTVRGDYSVDSPLAANRDHRAIHNLIHASETQDEAAHEIAHWFAAEDIHHYDRAEEDVMF